MMPTMLADRYQLGELIATGGMGTVHRAIDTHLGRPVAVKILKRVLADDATFLERFRREARAAAAISHPGVARVYDYGERSSEPFIVMELVEGDTLAERIAHHGLLPWQEAFAIAAQVASALSAAHAHGVVHRDVKPANILVDRSGRVKVTDFGIARAARATTLTRPGMVLGSANYVAPEQAQGNTVGPAADLYSLGCVLFESIVGTTPYQGGSTAALPRAGRGPRGAVEGHTPPMPWARVPGDVRPAAAGPGGPPGRLARGDTPAQRRSRRRATWLLGLALGLVALLALPLVLSRQSGDTSSAGTAGTAPATRGSGEGASLGTTQVRLPDLRGQRLGVATAKLRALDLEVDVQRERGGGRHAVVVSMSPGPGSVVDHGSTVQVVVGRPGKGTGGDGNEEGD